VLAKPPVWTADSAQSGALTHQYSSYSMSADKEVKKKQVELLKLMGYSDTEIAKALNLDRTTVGKYKEERFKEINRQMDNSSLTKEVVNNYIRLQEEAWKLFQKEQNAPNLRALNEVINSKTERLGKLGMIKVEPEKIELKTDPMSIQNLILLARKME